ncbi:hypothetical protein ACWKW6_33890 [Dyadobacter jiangsuensis]
MNRDWLEPWEKISDDQAMFIKAQLVKEITWSHPLFGLQLTPIGRSGANDDILVSLITGKLAVVHLTWGNPGDHLWPSIVLYDSWEEFVEKKMLEDNFGY